MGDADQLDRHPHEPSRQHTRRCWLSWLHLGAQEREGRLLIAYMDPSYPGTGHPTRAAVLLEDHPSTDRQSLLSPAGDGARRSTGLCPQAPPCKT